jgi:hypothetical protein
MADGVVLDPGTGGDTVAADDLGATGKAQWVKLLDGTDGGTQTIASGNGTAAASLRVTVASDSTGVLAVTDNGGSLTVDNSVLSVVGGGAQATAQRVTLSDETLAALESVTVIDGGGSLTVDNGGTFAVQDSEKLADDAAFTVGTTKVNPVGFFADQASTDSVNEGDIGAARMTLDRKQIVTVAPSADTEGLLIARDIDLDETESAVKTSAGKLYGWFIYNDGATEVYVKLYNDTVANVVVGTTTPAMTIPIPAGAAANVEFTNGIAFSAAITAAATTGVADADTAAPAANQVVANFFYQ